MSETSLKHFAKDPNYKGWQRVHVFSSKKERDSYVSENPHLKKINHGQARKLFGLALHITNPQQSSISSLLERLTEGQGSPWIKIQ